jgi:hypothetical protein
LLIAYCEFEFGLNRKTNKGKGPTVRETYQAANLEIEKWGYPEFPDSLQYLWEHFINLHNGRQSGMSLNPLSYEAIKAYLELMQDTLSVWEINALKRLDMAALNKINQNQEANNGG